MSVLLTCIRRCSPHSGCGSRLLNLCNDRVTGSNGGRLFCRQAESNHNEEGSRYRDVGFLSGFVAVGSLSDLPPKRHGENVKVQDVVQEGEEEGPSDDRASSVSKREVYCQPPVPANKIRSFEGSSHGPDDTAVGDELTWLGLPNWTRAFFQGDTHYSEREYVSSPERHHLIHDTIRGADGIKFLRFFMGDNSKHAVIVCETGQNVCGHKNIVHGGFTAALLDSSLGALAFMNVKRPATKSLTVHYTKPIMAGEMVVVVCNCVSSPSADTAASSLKETQEVRTTRSPPHESCLPFLISVVDDSPHLAQHLIAPLGNLLDDLPSPISEESDGSSTSTSTGPSTNSAQLSSVKSTRPQAMVMQGVIYDKTGAVKATGEGVFVDVSHKWKM
eukprot:GHVN01031443.1.p1 GENE.GHVN01031443.1~~GHVN01031443.1.p1  ORF type:complete len:388 (-),score=58.81 GHVN01031443.1:979-2142(-)